MAQSVKNQSLKFGSGIRVTLLWGLLVFMLGTYALADAPDTKALSEPIRIAADRLVTDTKTQTAQFSGSVHAVQGDTEIHADRLTVHYQSDDNSPTTEEAGAIKRITAQGHVNITFDNRLAVSEQAVYITSERILILEGPGSKVTSGQNEIVGSKITYFRNDGRVIIEGDDQRRVKAVFHSEPKKLK